MVSPSSRRWSDVSDEGQRLGDEPRAAARAVDGGAALCARRLDAPTQVGVHARRVMELAPRGDDVGARGEQPAHLVGVEGARHVQHAVGAQADDVLDVVGRHDAGVVEAAQVARVAAGLGGGVDPQPGQLEGRVLDHAAQRTGADVARRPLHDPVRRHASVPSSACGTQLGRPLLHERPHALAGLGRVVERPEHRLVVDVAVALVEHALHVHARLGRGLHDLLGGLDRRGPQVVVGHDPRDHAEALGLGGVEPAGRQQQVAGDGHADVRRQGGRVGGVGDAPQQLGDAERRPVAGDGDVGHHRHQQAAGLADAVDRGDHGRRAVADGEERQDLVAEAVGQPVARLLAAAQVAARREHVAGAGDDQRPQGRVGVDQAHRPLEAEVHGRGERVAGRGPVDHAPGDDAVALEAQAGGTEVVGGHAVVHVVGAHAPASASASSPGGGAAPAPPRSPRASSALCSVFSARRMWAASTSRPSRPMAPTPSASDLR